ncbi:MAG: glyoxylase-like metal-dependent hydrolase (beta-lactamase superfamily II) [Oceanicoccus sp.]|jgi:glyoxylase-like metal-dependent hydrolase (beta-lactamase superfamily II)
MKMKTMGAVIFGLVFSVVAYGGEKENQLVDAITTAYGGASLTNLKTFQIEDRFMAPTAGQSRKPGLQEINYNRILVKADIANKKASYDFWTQGRSGSFLNSTISDGETAFTIDYQSKRYGQAPSPDLYSFAGGSMRTSDAILAYEINKVKDRAKLLGDVDYLNRPHWKVSMPFPHSADLTLYVDKETHLISKMTRNNPAFGDLDYVYSNYTQNNGITYARNINFFLAGVPNLISTHHKLVFNEPIPEEAFEIPSTLREEGDRIDTSEMLVNEIAKGVYHIGQGAGYSIFVDTSDGIVAAGGYPALVARYERYKAESNVHKPLRYQIVTHHHSDHLGGLGEAAGLGATLVTVADNNQAIKDATPATPDAVRLLNISKRATFGEGKKRVEIFEVATMHAASFLVTYVPAEKLVFIADHMGSPYKTGIPTANLNTVTMHKALEALNLDIEKIATAHNARIFTWKEMEKSVAAYAPLACTNALPVCS